MSVLFYVLLFIILSVIVVDLILWQAWRAKPINAEPYTGELPFISILLAVRNEVHFVNYTLNSLEALDYPKDKYEVLMGDDESDDGSSKIMKAWDKETNNFFYIPIDMKKDNLDAKANVLAQLADKAKGEFLMMTDADAEVAPTWIMKNLACWKPGLGIQSGFTLVKVDSFFSSMQMVDWGLALGMVKIVTGWKIPVTAVGNNMMVSKEAYQKVGGYRAIPFSTTEDFALFQAIVRKGYSFQQLANEESLVYTQAIKGFWNLLEQRKRWMRGAMELPAFMKTLLLIQALYFPAMLIMIFVNPLVAIPLFGLKITLQSLFIDKILDRLNQYLPLGHLFIFEFYSGFLSVALMIYYLLPLPVKWKGRKYTKG
ncbi:glycosyltransferase [Marivirga sp. S37H4]|uniref:Glycosyltransferase n=1 Tax=Marivirga aurantiaca TaxID=2802615 RepID=A0A935C9R8_9BACT|nr:glycosyltransferase family 2 protein [Marivirga aurantiaca]MBK6266321.1 glycosyltransferase [Marivirga aurantiaca]